MLGHWWIFCYSFMLRTCGYKTAYCDKHSNYIKCTNT